MIGSKIRNFISLLRFPSQTKDEFEDVMNLKML